MMIWSDIFGPWGIFSQMCEGTYTRLCRGTPTEDTTLKPFTWVSLTMTLHGEGHPASNGATPTTTDGLATRALCLVPIWEPRREHMWTPRITTTYPMQAPTPTHQQPLTTKTTQQTTPCTCPMAYANGNCCGLTSAQSGIVRDLWGSQIAKCAGSSAAGSVAKVKVRARARESVCQARVSALSWRPSPKRKRFRSSVKAAAKGRAKARAAEKADAANLLARMDSA